MNTILTLKFNEALEAFDVATKFHFDGITDLKQLHALACSGFGFHHEISKTFRDQILWEAYHP